MRVLPGGTWFWGGVVALAATCAVAALGTGGMRVGGPDLTLRKVLVYAPKAGSGLGPAKSVADADASLEGVHWLSAWIADDANPLWFSGGTDDPRIDPNTPVGTALARVQALVLAYHARDLDAVRKLYEPSSAAGIDRMLSTDEKKQKWLEGVSSILRMRPLMVYQRADELVCVMEAETKTKEGAVSSSAMPLAVSAQGRLLSGKMDSAIDRDVIGYFGTAKKPAIGIAANYDYLSERASPGRGK